MLESKTLLLRETGIARQSDGTEAVNVGPIVAALGFLTEGRGDDRGTDEDGAPLPDLLSLAFDVVKSIIVGGRQAEYFRQVKVDFDAQSAAGGYISLSLAKQASAVLRSKPTALLAKAGAELRARVQELDAAAAELLSELEAIDAGKPRPKSRRKAKPTAKPARATRAKATPKVRPKGPPRAKAKVRSKPAPTPRPAAARKKKAAKRPNRKIAHQRR